MTGEQLAPHELVSLELVEIRRVTTRKERKLALGRACIALRAAARDPRSAGADLGGLRDELLCCALELLAEEKS